MMSTGYYKHEVCQTINPGTETKAWCYECDTFYNTLMIVESSEEEYIRQRKIDHALRKMEKKNVQ